jgi:hypothetical protein
MKITIQAKRYPNHFGLRYRFLVSFAVFAPWYHVGIDLVKMPKSKNGNSYILSLVDYFTKWPDQGRGFVNSVMSSLIEKTNAVHRISTNRIQYYCLSQLSVMVVLLQKMVFRT